MSNLTPIPLSQAHCDRMIASGYDPHQPGKKLPVKNLKAERILAERTPSRDARAQALLNNRSPQPPNRVRAIAPLLLGAALALGSSDVAAAELAVGQRLQGTMTVLQSWWHDHFASPLKTLTALNTWLALMSVPTLILLSAVNHNLKKMRKTMELQSTSKAEDSAYELPLIELGEGDDLLNQTEEKGDKSGGRWFVSGASRTGTVRSENQDSFHFQQVVPHGAIGLVADGMGGIEGGKQASSTVVDAVFESLGDQDLSHSDAEVLGSALEQGRDALSRTKQTGATTGVLFAVDRLRLDYATIGDGALAVVWPDGMVTQLLTPHHKHGYPTNMLTGFLGCENKEPPRLGTVWLEPGCTVLAMSDGASEIFEYESLIVNHEVVAALLKDRPELLADQMLQSLETARDEETNRLLHDDNMTLIIAHVTDEQGNEVAS